MILRLCGYCGGVGRVVCVATQQPHGCSNCAGSGHWLSDEDPEPVRDHNDFIGTD